MFRFEIHNILSRVQNAFLRKILFVLNSLQNPFCSVKFVSGTNMSPFIGLSLKRADTNTSQHGRILVPSIETTRAECLHLGSCESFSQDIPPLNDEYSVFMIKIASEIPKDTLNFNHIFTTTLQSTVISSNTLLFYCFEPWSDFVWNIFIYLQWYESFHRAFIDLPRNWYATNFSRNFHIVP